MSKTGKPVRRIVGETEVVKVGQVGETEIVKIGQSKYDRRGMKGVGARKKENEEKHLQKIHEVNNNNSSVECKMIKLLNPSHCAENSTKAGG